MSPKTRHDEIVETTNKVVDALNAVDLDTSLAVLSNLSGQIIADMAHGQPSAIKTGCATMVENIRRAAIAKLMHDDEERRKKLDDKS